MVGPFTTSPEKAENRTPKHILTGASPSNDSNIELRFKSPMSHMSNLKFSKATEEKRRFLALDLQNKYFRENQI
jgi:hypothetical protein